MSSFCGLRKQRPLRPRRNIPNNSVVPVKSRDKGKQKEADPGTDVRHHDSEVQEFIDEDGKGVYKPATPRRRTKDICKEEDFERIDIDSWNRAREDQLSTILELSSTRGNTPNWDIEEGPNANAKWDSKLKEEKDENINKKEKSPPVPIPKFATRANIKKTRFLENVPRVGVGRRYRNTEEKIPLMSYSGGRTPETPRSIAAPPRDLESISRIDKSLIFEHFTTNDAWELGSALRNRLLPLPTPVVIDISLANQNQILFRTCTHTGVMPDNDNWVRRKRNTVLRWGCSTWYMHCKFNGDEIAFREKYGLGNSAGDFAIHGGGVPIRVTGVEGVVAVVVVSGLKQDEDHGVIVEVIRELYY